MSEDRILKKLTNLGDKKARSFAKEAREELAKEYKYVIDHFYDEYKPNVYKRHNPGGMYQTYFSYLEQKNYIYTGGIQISTDDMYSDYRGPRDYVLDSFLNGYHGPAHVGIWSSIQPYEHMMKFRDMLIADFKRRCSAT